jgi:hypothetical protein
MISDSAESRLESSEVGKRIMFDERESVKEIIRDFLSENYPNCVNEFDVVFDAVYEAIDKREAAAAVGDNDTDEGALSFDGGTADSSMIVFACFVAYTMLKAALRDFTKRDLPKILDRVEAKLSTATGRPEVVKAIRQRVQGIMQAI